MTRHKAGGGEGRRLATCPAPRRPVEPCVLLPAWRCGPLLFEAFAGREGRAYERVTRTTRSGGTVVQWYRW